MRKTIFILLTVLLVYAGLGFWAVPAIVKPRLIATVSDVLHREVHIEAVRFNPFALSASIENFRAEEADGKALLSFQELYANLQASSLFRRALTLKEVRLRNPSINLSRLPNGRLNISDLLPPAEPKSEKAEPEKDLLPILVSRLKVEGGRLDLADLSRTEPFEVDYGPIDLQLNGFSTRNQESGNYTLQIVGHDNVHLAWNGSLSIQPLHSEGTFSVEGIPLRRYWRYFKENLFFEIQEGTIGLGGKYILDASGGAVQFALADGGLKLDRFVLSEKGEKDPLVSIPGLSVSGTALDLAGRQITVKSVNSQNAHVEGWVDSKGKVNFQQLFDFSGLQGKTAEDAAQQEATAASPWEVVINEVKLDRNVLGFEDRREAPVARVDLEAVSVILNNVTTRKDSRTQITAELAINQAGSLAVKGDLGLSPVVAACDVNLSQLALKPFQAFLSRYVNVEITDGAASLEGKLRVEVPAGSPPAVNWQGQLSIDSLASELPAASPFVKWNRLALNGITVATGPDKIDIETIEFDQPAAHVKILPDQSINLDNLLKKRDESAVPAKTEVEKAAPEITIGSVRIQDARVEFADASHQPAFGIGIYDLTGTVSGLSSQSWSRADVSLEGRIDKYSPVKISGQINPLSSDVYSDVDLLVQNVELPVFTPYSGKYVGRSIQAGKLSLDLQYKLSERVLIGENKVFFNQFTFGNSVESPHATTLPVNLAVALLKDMDGNIDIDLPVRGNLDDPDFSYGGLILDAVTNLIQSAATSPFNALAGLTGMDGETLSHIAFVYGSSELTEGETVKLDALANALAARPDLRLKIAGVAQRELDRRALAEKELRAQMQLEEISTEEEYDKRILTAYREAFGEEPSASLLKSEDPKSAGKKEIDKEVIVSAAKERLLETVAIDASALTRLGRERAEAIKAYLIEHGGISHERLFLIDPFTTEEVSEDQIVYIQLTLEAS